MKAVLISIQPKWCELIASGKKTVEVRRTKPKIDVPFKCYIYMTKAYDTLFGYGKPKKLNVGGGCVIGEFVCDKVTEIKSDAVYSKMFGGFDVRFNFDKYAACLSEEQIFDYLGDGKGYAWHISDLVIYDKPKECSEFKKIHRECWYADLGLAKRDCPECKNAGCFIQRPPQSWCYCEEMKGETE